ncbi:hypothetical protein GHT06_015238 [Daphnia sinensis]|uniref:Uncharacterized protein n=1 Tax=Daphnia sinensis TaxID=1820382 RepID=A0AAD5PT31_9CRUS|nr:hypothetical protein GHT06_015238 [Daphnia sinensis]
MSLDIGNYAKVNGKLRCHEAQHENETIRNSMKSDEADLYGAALPPHLRQPMPNNASRISTSNGDRGIGLLPANCGSSEHSSFVDVEYRALKMKRQLLGADEDEESKQPKREKRNLKRKIMGWSHKPSIDLKTQRLLDEIKTESLLKVHSKELKKKDNLSKSTEREPFDREEYLKLNKLDDAKRK